jgi:hypothetical protein
VFLQQGMLPYSFGFVNFANAFQLSLFVGLIWMFGIIAGIFVFALCFFQVVYNSVLWVFHIPWFLKIRKGSDFSVLNLKVYGRFPYLVVLIAVLVIANFFITPYKSVWSLVQEDVWCIAITVAVLVVGALTKYLTMFLFFKGKFQ